MAKMKFTQTNVRKLKVPDGKTDVTIWDAEMKGFGVRVRAGYPAVFVLQYCVNGRQGKITLGDVHKINFDDAKNAARAHFKTIHVDEKDPILERDRIRRENGDRFGERIEEFIEFKQSLGLDDAYIADHRRCLGYLEDLHPYRFGEISRAMMAKALDKIAEEHGDRQAGNARTFADGYYKWIITKGFEGNNPVTGTVKRGSKRRSRYLSPSEVVAIWNACDGEGDFDKIVRLLILTAARITQIGSLNRRELKHNERLLEFVPPHVRAERGENDDDDGKTKNREIFVLPLCDMAATILASVPPRSPRSGRSWIADPAADYVFGEGEGGFVGWTRAKGRLDKKLNGSVGKWTFHDFRRTFNNLGVDFAGIDDQLADICLNHVGEHKKGVKRNYNGAVYVAKKRAAYKLWEDYLKSIGCRL